VCVMKKFLAVLFILLFTAGDAFATIEVRYNNAGARHSVAYGAHAPRSAVRFGRNSALLPTNFHRAPMGGFGMQRAYAVPRGMNNRNYARPRGVGYGGNAIAVSNSAPMSRLDRNYTVNRVQRTYTRGGVTYYN